MKRSSVDSLCLVSYEAQLACFLICTTVPTSCFARIFTTAVITALALYTLSALNSGLSRPK